MINIVVPIVKELKNFKIPLLYIETEGHYCYDCKEYFHDSNPNIKSHENCKHNEFNFGICVNKNEFMYDDINQIKIALNEI